MNEVEVTLDPTAPTCSRCGAVVHDPCPTDEAQAGCQLPDFCFPNGRPFKVEMQDDVCPWPISECRTPNCCTCKDLTLPNGERS